MPITAGFLEPMCESIPLGIYASWSACYLFGISPYIWFAVHWLVWFLLDYVQLRGIQVRKICVLLYVFSRAGSVFKPKPKPRFFPKTAENRNRDFPLHT